MFVFILQFSDKTYPSCLHINESPSKVYVFWKCYHPDVRWEHLPSDGPSNIEIDLPKHRSDAFATYKVNVCDIKGRNTRGRRGGNFLHNIDDCFMQHSFHFLQCRDKPSATSRNRWRNIMRSQPQHAWREPLELPRRISCRQEHVMAANLASSAAELAVGARHQRG